MAELNSDEIADYPNKTPQQQQAIREIFGNLLTEVKDVVSQSDFEEMMDKIGFVPNPG